MDEAYSDWAALAAPLICELAQANPDMDDELFDCFHTGPSLQNLSAKFVDIFLRLPNRGACQDDPITVPTGSARAADTVAYNAILILMFWVDQASPQLAPDVRVWIAGREFSAIIPATLHVKADARLAQACLHALQEKLHFNITRCESSYVVNDDQGQANWLTLDHGLIHACRFWAYHLTHTHDAVGLMGQVKDFLGTKLLFWLEVMSVLDKMEDAVAILSECIAPDFIQVRALLANV